MAETAPGYWHGKHKATDEVWREMYEAADRLDLWIAERHPTEVIGTPARSMIDHYRPSIEEAIRSTPSG